MKTVQKQKKEKPYHKESAELIQQLHLEGYTVDQLSQILFTSRRNVFYWLSGETKMSKATQKIVKDKLQEIQDRREYAKKAKERLKKKKKK